MNDNRQLPDAAYGEEQENEGNLVIKRNRAADFIAKIVCLLLAFFLWYYASSEESTMREETYSIPIRIVNESGYSVLSGDDVTVDLTVTGKRTIVNRLSAGDFSAYVDVSDVTSAGRYRFDIQFDLPNGVALTKTNLSSITVYMDNTSSVTVPVKVGVTGYMLENDYELGLSAVTTDVKHITVTGPESVLNTLEYAYLPADIGRVTGTVRYSGDLILIDTDGSRVTNSYLSLSSPTATAVIPVYKYRDVPIDIVYRYGFFNSGNCEVSVEPASIRIRGEADAVDAVRLSYEIDEKKISGDVSYSLGISLPTGVQNVSGVDSASVSIRLRGMSTKTVSLYNVSVYNPNNLIFEDMFERPIEIRLCGETARLTALSASSLSVVIDLSAQNGTGTVEAPVTIRFPQDAGLVYELGDYTVQIRITG